MSKNRKKSPTKYRHVCFYCGGVLCWDSANDRSDDDDAIVDFYHCMQCGTSYEVYEPNEEEKQDYKEYWEKCQQNQNK